MKAILYERYGSPDVLELREIDKPVPKDNEVLVRIRASSANAQEWHFMRGSPYFMRVSNGLFKPKDSRLGADFAGTVEAVGKDVTEFKPGDEVFGMRWGAYAEYVTVSEKGVVHKPANVTFEQAAAVGVTALTALQGLRDKGQLQPGQKVLINGAGGGVGKAAVPIAKALGAEVTAVSKATNADMLRSLGADHFIDYTKDDFTKNGKKYDLIYDLGATHSLSATLGSLKPDGTLVMAGYASMGDWLGPLPAIIAASIRSRFAKQTIVFYVSERTKEDLLAIQKLLETGKLVPVIDKVFPLSQTAEAIRYVEDGQSRGKVVITVP